MAKQVFALGVVFVSAVGAGILYGCGGSGNGNSLYALSVSRVKTLNTGLLLYVNDNDDVLPPGVQWMDALGPYIHDANTFHSPMLGNIGYGYALNAAVAGKVLNTLGAPDATVTIFDSTDVSRNATAPTSSMPTPPRYAPNNTVGYLDGHVKDEQAVVTPPPDPYETSMTRLKQSGLGVIMYSNDYDDHLPLNNTWMDAVLPYTKTETVFHSPALKANPSAYGYAFNADLVGVSWSSLLNPATTPMLFDSTVVTRNATASTSTMPNPARYSGKNTVVHADGGVAP